MRHFVVNSHLCLYRTQMSNAIKKAFLEFHVSKIQRAAHEEIQEQDGIFLFWFYESTLCRLVKPCTTLQCSPIVI